MAKASQRSRRRTKANARKRVRGTAGISHESLKAQDEMFFMRVRRHARWVFVLLALVFALAFAFAGVGSGSTGIGDMLGGSLSIFGGGSSSNPVKAAEKKVRKAGNDQAKLAPALLELARAQAAKATSDESEATYRRYLALRPKDASARQQLATLYRNEADLHYAQLGEITVQVSETSPVGATFVTDPIQAAAHQDAVSTATEIYAAFKAAKDKELAELARAAAVAGSGQRSLFLETQGRDAADAVRTALAFSQAVPDSPQATSATSKDATTWAATGTSAFKQLLTLHRHDSLTAQIKQQIAELKPFATAAAKTIGR